MTVIKLIYLLLAFLLCLQIHAQQGKREDAADSLITLLSAAPEDTNKVDLYRQIFNAYYDSKPNDCFKYAHEGLALARKINWKLGIAKLTNGLGLALSDTGNYALALKYFEESLSISTELKASVNVISVLTNIGRVHSINSDFPKATDFFLKGFDLAQKINSHQQIALVGTNLTSLYYNQRNYVKAEEYALMTIKSAEIARYPEAIGFSLMLLGEIKLKTGDTATSKDYYKKSYDLFDKEGFSYLAAEALNAIAKVESNKKEALSVLLAAREIFDKTSPNSLASINNLDGIGTTYMSLYTQEQDQINRSNYLKKAKEYLERMIRRAKELNFMESLSNGLAHLSELEEKQGNYSLALEYNKQNYKIYDSIYSQENKNKIAAIEGQREVAIRDKEIEINKLALSNQRKTQFVLIGGLVLLGIIGGLLYWQARTRKKTNTTLMVLNNELDEANKIKTKFFSILSHDLRSPVANLINYLHLQQQSPDLLDKDSSKAYTQKITSSAERLLENMEGLLLWSKGQMEQFKPAKRDIAISKLFADIENTFSGINAIKINFWDEQQLLVNTDEDYLKTIMRNLTGNAIKALHNKADALIEWRAWEENGKHFLSITDNGTGISDQQLNALNKDDSPIGIKSGLGLHLVRDMARAIACTISVHTTPGKGTRFELAI